MDSMEILLRKGKNISHKIPEKGDRGYKLYKFSNRKEDNPEEARMHIRNN